jgi:hypothetical protein
MVGFNIVLLTLTAKLLRTIDEQIMNMDKLKKYILKINLTQKIIVIIFIFHITTGYALLKGVTFICDGQTVYGDCTGDDMNTVFFGILITLLFSFFLIGNKKDE